MAGKITKDEAEKRIAKLKEVINYHRYLYHVEDNQEISDEALDSLKHELKDLEDKFPGLITADSPSQRVSGAALPGFKKVEHEHPMLSIDDIFNREELDFWEAYLQRIAGKRNISYFCEVKADGLALSLKYKKGVLYQAATRGNGRVGEDITSNARTIESIPLRLHTHSTLNNKELQKTANEIILSEEVEVRGEIYIAKKDFEDFNKERKNKGEELFANPRNLAAGSVRQLDPGLASSRPLSFLAYDIVGSGNFKYHSQEHEVLNAIGFKTDSTSGKCANIDEVYAYWQNTEKIRENIPYQIDGVVISVNDNSLFEELGVAGKSPRGIRAFKFTPKQATTVLEDVKMHIGRTGAITPLAVLKPVKVGGVTISRATLHNFEEIERLDARIGDTVIIERAGDVIPKVVEVLREMRPFNAKKIKLPTKCPKCGTGLVKNMGEVILHCPNDKCESRKQEYLNYFVSRAAFDIDGMGPKIVNQLLEEGVIAGPIDIFKIEEEDLLPLERFSEKSARNLVDSIEKSKKIPLFRFITALNIRHVGEETAIDLAQYFGSIKKLKESSLDELMRIDGIGEKVAGAIHEWFSKKENIRFVESLLAAGVKVVPPLKKIEEKLAGTTFVFTGSMESMSRDDAEKAVRSLGGSSASSVSSNTDYLVAGKGLGSKRKKAQELGVKIINEDQFLALIK
ncbi:MAG: NAD-dependent DNA ligase LigA [Candidatus Spechtbacterales bacterium]